jgi:predicted Rossmann fold flavoprotein
MHDVVIVGAGAAGLFCAARAAQAGCQVVLIDHAQRVAEKIRISGGGRCNFTNRDVSAGNFLSANPHFCRSALARYTPRDFVALVELHGITWHEKHKGQLFCDRSSDDIIRMLLRECEQGRVDRRQPCSVTEVRRTEGGGFELVTSQGLMSTRRLVIATGGLSIAQIGATDWGYRVARQLGHHLIDTRPALVPLTFAPSDWAPFVSLAGLSLPARVQAGAGRTRGDFLEDLLFTHRGLSGPAILQISSYWQPGTPLTIDLAPGQSIADLLTQAKRHSKRLLAGTLAELLPRRLVDTWLTVKGVAADRPLAEQPDRELTLLGKEMNAWQLTPNGTEGYRKAEVTSGGVDTREIDSRSMESLRVPGLYFIGEVLDVTGWLGGYNFQWAWASAAACASALAGGSSAAA